MSLVDPKHLAGPFKNTVHLIAIVFIVLLFAVYRLSSGGVEVVDSHSANTQPAAQNSSVEPKTTDKKLLTLGTPSAGDSRDLTEIERALGLSK